MSEDSQWQSIRHSKRPLPDGRRWARIADICEVATGGTPDTGHPEYYGGEICWLKSGDIKGMRIFDVPNRLSALGLTNSNARIHPAGSVMLAMSGQDKTRGTSAILMVPSACSQSVAALLPSAEALPEIIHFALVHRYQEIRRITGDNERTGLNLRLIRTIEIPLPPMVEQQRIVPILTEQMKAVDQARAAAEVRLESARALPSAYLRAIFESLEAKRWERRLLAEVCGITARQVDPKLPEYAGLPHVSGENIESGMCRLTHLKSAAEDAMISGKYLFEPGDVLYSKLRPYLRKVLVADFRGVCSADMYPIRVRQEVLDPRFAAWMLVSDEFTRYADAESRRARMPKLNREQLFAWKAPLPPISDQRRLVSMVEDQLRAVGRAREAVKEEFATINALPAAFLRGAFSGEV